MEASLPAVSFGGMHMDEDEKKIVIKAHDYLVRLYCLYSKEPAGRIKERRKNRPAGKCPYFKLTSPAGRMILAPKRTSPAM